MTLQASLVFLLIACLCAICQVSESETLANDCCLSVKNKEIPLRNLRCYQVQNEMSNCNLNAVVFTTRRNKHLCAPHNEKWVTKLKRKLGKCKNKKH